MDRYWCSSARDWHRTRNTYLTVWHRTLTWRGAPRRRIIHEHASCRRPKDGEHARRNVGARAHGLRDRSSGQRVSLPPYRARILGVFDDATGAPLDSVRVTDVLNGNSSLTTATGTVALYFLPDGGALVRLQKLGYEVQTFPIAISPADTVAITITLRRVTEPVRL